MRKTIEWTDAARAYLRRIDRETAMRILEGLARFLFISRPTLSAARVIRSPGLSSLQAYLKRCQTFIQFVNSTFE